MEVILVIARKQKDDLCENVDKLVSILVNGNLGIMEKHDHELEELYEEVIDKPVKIHSK